MKNEENDIIIDRFLKSIIIKPLTAEEKKRAMSDEFAYLDDDKQITPNSDNVFEVIDTLKLGDNLLVTLKGKCSDIKNGSKLKDSSGNIYDVISAGMTRFDKPTDIIQYIDVLFMPCALAKGAQLYYVPDEG